MFLKLRHHHDDNGARCQIFWNHAFAIESSSQFIQEQAVPGTDNNHVWDIFFSDERVIACIERQLITAGEV